MKRRKILAAASNREVLVYEGIVLRESDLRILRNPCYLNDQIIGFYFTHLTRLLGSDDILLLQPSLSFWLTNAYETQSIRDFVEPLNFSTKKLILFPVNNCDDLETADSGTHWSLLVFCRDMNAFLHHDSLGEFNSYHAMSLYKVVRNFVGDGSSTFSNSNSSLHKKQTKEHMQQLSEQSTIGPAAVVVPGFRECRTPQQTNGYDCGLYVMAIARTICQWHADKSEHKDDNWFSSTQENVDSSIEFTMRAEVIELIEDLRD